MATTDRPRGTDASEVATACRTASFAHLVARADGDALAAASLLAAVCEETGTPYQVSTVRTRSELDARLEAVDDATTPIAVGTTADCVAIVDAPVSLGAVTVAEALGASPDPIVALAGVTAAGDVPGQVADELLDVADLERGSGVAIPTEDVEDGLCHTTLAHAEFSGEPDSVAVGPAASPREVASLFALAVTGASDASARAGTMVERALRPHVGGPLRTVGGYADVLNALARRAPGLGVALGLGQDVHEQALDVWRARSRAAHDGVREASTARYDGLVVARTDGPVEPVARLLCDFRSPEPAVLAVSEGEAALATVESPATPLERAVERVGGSALIRDRCGYARFDAGVEALIDAVQEER